MQIGPHSTEAPFGDVASGTVEVRGDTNSLRGAQQGLNTRPIGIAQTASVGHGKSPVLTLSLRQPSIVRTTTPLWWSRHRALTYNKNPKLRVEKNKNEQYLLDS